MPTKNKKKSAKSAGSISARTIPEPPAVNLPPLPPESKQRHGRASSSRLAKPTEIQRTEAEKLAAELRAASEFDADFGRIGVDPQALADRLEAAAAWDRFYEASAGWAPVARSIRTAAWDAVLRDMKPVGKFLAGVGASSEVGKRYPAAVTFFEVRKEIAARSVATRRANRKSAAASKAAAATK